MVEIECARHSFSRAMWWTCNGFPVGSIHNCCVPTSAVVEFAVVTNTFLSLAAQKLAKKGRQSEIARRCRVSQQAVSHWLKGRSIPTDGMKSLLRQEFGIAIKEWAMVATS